MPNTFFKFKQFTVHQDACAMKVCTDACLFGAIVSLQFSNEKIKRVLDIGTGTGLLSLMFAQKNPGTIIDAIEIDEAAAMQATANFQGSLWNDRLNIYNTSIQKFKPTATKRYNLVISNPPFYENDLKSENVKRNLALHSDKLSLVELIEAAQKNISEDGVFAVLLPFHRSTLFEELAQKNNFYLNKKILVKQTPAHNFFRSILFFSTNKTIVIENEVTIKNEQNQYGLEFTDFLKDYYLQF